MHRHRHLVLALSLLITVGGGLGVAARAQETEQETPEPAPVTLEKLVIEPAEPGVDTLCSLRVALRNQGDQVVSQFGFTVTIDGVELPVYRNQLFMYPVGPGETVEIPLYNFWTTETSRPPPTDGELDVRVELGEAQWMRIEMEDEVEVWTPQGAVDGLPVATTRTLTLASS